MSEYQTKFLKTQSELIERIKNGNAWCLTQWNKCCSLADNPDQMLWLTSFHAFGTGVDKLNVLATELAAMRYHDCIYGELFCPESPKILHCFVCTETPLKCEYASEYHNGKVEWHHPISSEGLVGMELCQGHHSIIADHPRVKLYPEEIKLGYTIERMYKEIKILEQLTVELAGFKVEDINKH